MTVRCYMEVIEESLLVGEMMWSAPIDGLGTAIEALEAVKRKAREWNRRSCGI